MSYRRHFFVCVGSRPPFARPSCAPRGSGQLLEALTAAVLEAGLATEVGVTGTLCLGPCETGPTMVVYPEGVWYGALTLEDVAEIVRSHAVGGTPVERLRSPPPLNAQG